MGIGAGGGCKAWWSAGFSTGHAGIGIVIKDAGDIPGDLRTVTMDAGAAGGIPGEGGENPVRGTSRQRAVRRRRPQARAVRLKLRVGHL